MGTGPQNNPPPTMWGNEGRAIRDIWEPPAPLAWVERHPNLATLVMCVVIIIAGSFVGALFG